MIYFDLETQNMSYEVGGWFNIAATRLAVAVSWDEDNGYRTWWEQDAADLAQELLGQDLIIGYNVNRFDFQVLTLYSDLADQLSRQAFDVLAEIKNQGLPLVSLDSLALRNLGVRKMADARSAVELWRAGELGKLQAKCQQDTEFTRDLVVLWEKDGLLWIDDQRYAIWPGFHVTSAYWGTL